MNLGWIENNKLFYKNYNTTDTVMIRWNGKKNSCKGCYAKKYTSCYTKLISIIMSHKFI